MAHPGRFCGNDRALPSRMVAAKQLQGNAPSLPKSIDRLGFTLIEVMLAILILGIGLVVLVNSTSRCLAVVKSARLYEDARHLLARVELEFPIERDEIDEGRESGTFDGQYGKYRWEREITISGEEEDAFYEVATRIIWSETGNRQGREEVVTYMYVPESAEKGSF